MISRLRAVAALSLSAALLSGCMVTTEQSSSSDNAKRLRLALNFSPVAELSPYTDDATSLTRMGVAEPLITIDAHGKPQSALAESFELGTGDTVARFTLRDGVSFHDGTPVTAEAAAASIQHALDATPAPGTVSGRSISVAAEGEDQVVVTSAEPDPLLVLRFANPELVILAPKAYAADPNKPNALDAGTGPFELSKLDGNQATLEANSNYWGGTPQLTGVDVQFIGDAQARVSGLRAGELDVIQNVPIAQLPNLPKDQVESRPVPRTTGLYLNTKGVLADPALRSAVAQAIDAEAIAGSVYEGQADVAEGLFRGDTDWTKNRPAPQLPTPADPSGKKITLATYDDRPELPEALTVLADQLRQAGFDVAEPVVKSYPVLEPELLAGQYDVVLASRMYLSQASDPLTLLDTDFSCDGGYNLAFLCDAHIDSHLAEFFSSASTPDRLLAAAQLEAEVLGTAAYVPVVHERLRIGRVPGVTGIAEDPLEWRIITHETVLQ